MTTNFDGVIAPEPAWADVPMLGLLTPVIGGAGGASNAQAFALAARTAHLQAAVAALTTTVEEVGGAALLLHGETAPLDALGADGDLYIDTVAADLYTKAAGNWGTPVSLVGPAGAAGAAGGGTGTAGGARRMAVFSQTGNFTWTVPAGVTSAVIEIWGAGGSGATVINSDAGDAGGGGGGAGAYTKAWRELTPGDVLPIVVGTGGYALAVQRTGAADPSGSGTISKFGVWGTGSYAQANAGSVATGTSGGAGGVTTNAANTLAYQGQAGESGKTLTVPVAPESPPLFTPFPGRGGASPCGGGGGGARIISPYNTATSAGSSMHGGVTPGGGGGGCHSDSNIGGGNGGHGLVIIEYTS